jgi:uncharacterized protein (DUF488 family)
MVEVLPQEILTVGHSNHSIEDFIILLKNQSVQVVADVRSAPYSRFHPQFNRGSVDAYLLNAGMDYVFMGDQLGARPADQVCYKDGRVDFRGLENSPNFQDGLCRLIQAAHLRRVSLMCAERDPIECHRMVLISRALSRKGVPVKHVLSNGRLESNEDAERRLVKQLDIQGSLFEPILTLPELIEKAYEVQGQKIAYGAEPVGDVSSLRDTR